MRKKIWGAAVVIAPLLAGCAASFQSDEISTNDMPPEPGRAHVEDSGQKPPECVPYARDHSAVKIYGDAYTWWDKAADKYQRGATPQTGAVMVLSGYAGPDRAHVAVVERIVSPREIRVDHANWLDDGSIYVNDPVADISPDNDWSVVRVFNIKTGAWGGHTYPVQGFILAPGQAPDAPGLPAPALAAHVEKPLPEPRPVSPKATPPQAAQPLRPHDLTPQDRELEPASSDNPGPIALAEMPGKAR